MKKERQTAYAWRDALKSWPWLATVPFGLLLPRITEGNGRWIERVYASTLYPPIKNALLAVSGRVPFSFAELILYVLCALVPLSLLIWSVRAIREREGKRLVRNVMLLGIAFGVGLNLFYATWGLNYFRAPLSERLGLTLSPKEPAALAALLSELAEEANALRAEVRTDGAGLSAFSSTEREARESLLPAYAALSAEYPVFSGRVAAAKPVLFSTGLSRAGISGIYVGLTAEANVNVDQPAFSIPAAAAHEMAHQLGIASEDAAEFTAFLACQKSPDPFIRYSGVMQMLIRAGNRLREADPEAYQAAVDGYSPQVKRDLSAQAQYWRDYDGPVEEFFDDMNDGYLKHNAQPSGLQSYGEAVDLLLAWREVQNIF